MSRRTIKFHMTIVTDNNTYTLKDMGDGAFLMTSTNPKYAGPVVVTCDPLTVGFPAYMRFRNGLKAGRTLITTAVRKVYDQA